MKKRFTEEQIIRVIKEQENGASVDEICRRHGIGNSTFYKWKSKFGGMEVSEAKRLRELEAENRKLKHLFRYEQNVARSYIGHESVLCYRLNLMSDGQWTLCMTN